MLIERYPYQTVKREEINGKRYYVTHDGQKLPSVTTILDKTKPEESRKALAEWKRKVGEKQAQKITTEAANRGTRMHSYLEHFVKTGQFQPRGGNPFSWPSHAMAQEIINQGLINVTEFWGVEVPLYFPQVYAGTTDGAGVHLNQQCILDYKQSNRPKRREWIQDYFLQLAAYAEAHNELYGTNIRKGVILLCVKPELDEQYNFLAPPQYQEFVLEGDEFEHYRAQWWKRVEEFYLLNM